MKRLLSILLGTFLVSLCAAAPALADFGLKDLGTGFTDSDGSPSMLAGSHPFAFTTTFDFNTTIEPQRGEVPDGAVKNLTVELPPGLVGTPTPVSRCSSADFLHLQGLSTETPELTNDCSDSTAVGVAELRVGLDQGPGIVNVPVYNLLPPPGVAAKLGFIASTVPVTVDIGVNPEPPYNLIASATNISQGALVFGSKLTVWGDPASPEHDTERGNCAVSAKLDSCPAHTAEKPFLTLPTSCTGPLPTSFGAISWQSPDAPPVGGTAFTEDELVGCDGLSLSPSVVAQPTTHAAESPSGLDFNLDINDEGLTSPTGTAQSDIKKAVVTMPRGLTANPSFAEGLATCSEADLARETMSSEAGQGCPEASKIGTVEVETPLLEGTLLKGQLFIASQMENPFHSLLALYMVIKDPELGILVKLPGKVEPDSQTGQLVTTFGEAPYEIPQFPFSHLRFHLREGGRSPFVTPPACGEYQTVAEFTPWSGRPPVVTTAPFAVTSGVNGGSCPAGGIPPFHPGLEAGTINNAAGHYSPFYVHLTRTDSEQEITHFSIKLPPGVTGKLAGIPECSDAAITAAKARTGPHGGEEELDNPSCPAASEVGHTLVGAGVGPLLAYASGKVYLAGPYRGSQLSIAAITAAKVGPFDLGTVVVREALKVNPETAEVFVDAAGSDPIPHIIAGIPVHARDIRIFVDRPEFVLNPTSCERTSTASTVLGSGQDFASEADDQPVTVTSPFQAADCASLGFAPKLALSLKGGTKRGATPAFKAVLTARKGDANIREAQVTLPHSEFLEQAHIKTICTRVQFNEGTVPGERCPTASIYGKAKAITPLLDEPLSGPVYLRSSSHNLPDLVAALHSGEINIALDGHIDSVKGGRIRNTFEAVPDAPVTKFTLEMQGGKKGLLVNSTNLCKSTNKAIADFTGQNGKIHDFNPVLTPSGCSAKAKKRLPAKRSAARRLLRSAW